MGNFWKNLFESDKKIEVHLNIRNSVVQCGTGNSSGSFAQLEQQENKGALPLGGVLPLSLPSPEKRPASIDWNDADTQRLRNQGPEYN